MATYQLISSQVLSSTAATVTFSSIPGTYKDLVIKMSSRTDQTGTNSQQMTIFPNSNTSSSTDTSRIILQGAGSSGKASYIISNSAGFAFQSDAGSAAANVFSNAETYIPNYTSTTNRAISNFSIVEDNATAVIMRVNAILYRGTAAITSLTLSTDGNGNFVSGSSFYLYGI